jgi:hypothetical protein
MELTSSASIRRRARSALALVAVFAFAGSVLAPSASAARLHAAKGGSYHGSQKNGFGLSFQVSGNGRQVQNFDTWVEAGCTSQPVHVVLERVPVRGNRFSTRSHQGGATAHLSGRFLKGGRAVGLITWTVAHNSSCNSHRSFSAGS